MRVLDLLLNIPMFIEWNQLLGTLTKATKLFIKLHIVDINFNISFVTMKQEEVKLSL